MHPLNSCVGLFFNYHNDARSNKHKIHRSNSSIRDKFKDISCIQNIQ